MVVYLGIAQWYFICLPSFWNMMDVPRPYYSAILNNYLILIDLFNINAKKAHFIWRKKVISRNLPNESHFLGTHSNNFIVRKKYIHAKFSILMFLLTCYERFSISGRGGNLVWIKRSSLLILKQRVEMNWTLTFFIDVMLLTQLTKLVFTSAETQFCFQRLLVNCWFYEHFVKNCQKIYVQRPITK